MDFGLFMCAAFLLIETLESLKMYVLFVIHGVRFYDRVMLMLLLLFYFSIFAIVILSVSQSVLLSLKYFYTLVACSVHSAKDNNCERDVYKMCVCVYMRICLKNKNKNIDFTC